MDLRTAQEMILSLVIEHDVTNWTVKFSRRMTRTLGLCSPATRTLTFSVPMILANGEDEIRDTALHEIAHAIIADRYPLGVERLKVVRGVRRKVYVNPGHGSEWQAMARAIGARPSATTSSAESVPARYHGSCPCGTEFRRHKRPKDGFVCRRANHKIKWIDTNNWSMLYPVPWS